jgi:hypothetical protein
MNFLRSLKTTKYCCIFFVFHILNLSVDAPDAQPMSLAEDLSFNDQESLIEFVTEHIFGLEDVFPETDDDDNNSHSEGLHSLCQPISSSFKFEKNCFQLRSSKYLCPAASKSPQPPIASTSPPPEMQLI